MPITKPDLSKTIHQEAFSHYLRTGERLTNTEWLARHERKFNPYHDEIGRFTSPPGVTVSYGRRDRPTDRRTPTGERPRSRQERVSRQTSVRRKEPVQAGVPKRAQATNAAVGTAIQDAWAPPAPIVSHFDLNKRQAHLDDLRRKAGPNLSAVDRAAFEETQRRLDAARSRLAEGDRIADRKIVEIARTILPPVDTGLSAASLLSGEGDLGDALTVASSVPIVGAAGKLGKVVLRGRIAAKVSAGAAKEIIQLGGPHWRVRRLKPEGYQPHHIPPASVNGLGYGEGPTIAMRTEHHQRTASHSRVPGSKTYLAKQRDLIKQGKFREAVEMDIADIRKKFGNDYDDAIDQMLKYIDKKGY